jgi:hypothetical protein
MFIDDLFYHTSPLQALSDPPAKREKTLQLPRKIPAPINQGLGNATIKIHSSVTIFSNHLSIQSS